MNAVLRDSPTPLRVLHVEDNPQDAALVDRELRQGGFELLESKRVETHADLERVLREQPWDVVLCDFDMPQLDALAALRTLQDSGLDIPMIVITGTASEEMAVEVMRAGGRDYIPKAKLVRLVPALRRELEDAHQRRLARRRAELQAMLGHASAALAENLDLDATIATIAKLAVPALADWCGVYTMQPDGGLALGAVEHPDPQRKEALQRYFQRNPLSRQTALAQVAEGTAVQRLPQLSAQELAAAVPDPEDRRLLEALHLGELLNIPLRSRGRARGVLSLAMNRDERRFDALAEEFAGELSARAAAALENALLYREAQEAVRLREEFMTVAAHELRTPVAIIQLQVEVVESRLAAGMALGQLQSRMGRVRRQTERLGALIEGMLDVSRLRTGKLELARAPVDLAQLTRDVVDQLSDEAARIGSTLQLQLPAHLTGAFDGPRLEQVLVNLLTNAFKFGAGTPIEVSLSEHDRRARIAVRDGGIGIPEDQLDRIFERFGRAVPARTYGGLGLGLYIAREIVAAHGGKIWAENRRPTGSAFHVELPLDPP